MILRQARGEVRLAVYATGERATAGEPIRLGVVAKDRQPKLLEQTGDEAEKRFLRELGKLCRQVEQQAESPIFQAVSAVVRTLPQDQCALPGNTCQVWVRTDGIEESDSAVMALLRPKRTRASRRRAHVAAQPARINNRGIDVVFCGLSERRVARRSRRRPPSIAQVQAAFIREFTRPERVGFDTSCAPYELGPAATAQSRETDPATTTARKETRP